MGIQVSTTAGKLAFEPKRRSRVEKVPIGILAFEVASVMSKSLQLWQSLSDQEVHRLRAEVLKSEGVLNLIADDENVLLSLACMEKLQDLTAVACTVARLGKRCHEPALAGFEHIYNDVLKQNIDVRGLAFPYKKMVSKMRKMERYVGATSNLYVELEALSALEQAIKRLLEEEDPQKENLFALEQKAVWQRQEIKFLKEISLWNCTYDKIVGLLARTICTIYGRIVSVFGFPIYRWPEILCKSQSEEACKHGSLSSCLLQDQQSKSVNGSSPQAHPSKGPLSQEPYQHEPQISTSSRPVLRSGSFSPSTNGNIDWFQPTGGESYMALSHCFSPGRQFSQQRSKSVSYASRDESLRSSPAETHMHEDNNAKSQDVFGYITSQSNTGGFGEMLSRQREGGNKFLFDPKSKLQNAPASTLGGAALAPHYANVIIVAERMVRYPQLISQDDRDDLYNMLPKNVRMALRARLKSCMRGYGLPDCGGFRAADWREVLEKILGWLAPLAHNMIRWQSEHNFEQQQAVSRTNVLLLQTLYFADQVKAERAILELLVGLNYLWRQERESNANSLLEYASNKDPDEYLDWQF